MSKNQPYFLKDICSIKNGSTPSTTESDHYNGNIIWITPKDLSDQKSRYIYSGERSITRKGYESCSTTLLPKGTILLSSRAPIGLLAIAQQECCTNQGFKNLVLDTDKVDGKFLYYYLKQHIKEIENLGSGTTFKEVSKTSLENWLVKIPGIKTQQGIADILSTLDDKIELNNKINSELEAMARDLYDYWFVQFDFPDANGRPYKSAGGAMVFNETLNREIPAGWEVQTILSNNIAKIMKPGIERFDGGKIYLATACIENDRITDTTNKITFDNREGRANMQPVANSVWFAKMKNTKKILYFGDYSNDRMADFIISTGMLGLKCQDYALEYIWNFVNNAGFETLKNKLSHGATQEGVNNDDLGFFPLLVPSQAVLELYSAQVQSIYKQKYLNEQESERLANIRDFLLPMLMNGQVSVTDN